MGECGRVGGREGEWVGGSVGGWVSEHTQGCAITHAEALQQFKAGLPPGAHHRSKHGVNTVKQPFQATAQMMFNTESQHNPTATDLRVVELRDMGNANEYWVARILELHLNSYFSVANHQPSIRVLCFQLQNPLQGQRPTLPTEG